VGVPPPHTAKRFAATGPYAHRESNESSWPADCCCGPGIFLPWGWQARLLSLVGRVNTPTGLLLSGC
jgi:hypothetical protein